MRPSRQQLYLIGAWMLLALASAFYPFLEGPLVAVSIAVPLLIIVDALAVWGEPRLRIERDIPHNLPLGAWSKVKLRTHNLGKRAYALKVFDHYPQHAEITDLPHSFVIEPGQFADITYRLQPTRRGDAAFTGTEVELRSRFGLWRRHHLFKVEESVKVYPNFSEVTKYSLFSTENQLAQLGIRRQQQRGEGLDFHQLREYRQGDNLRQIDWKATARLHKLISREYQVERDQQLIFLVDCSRRMRSQDEDINHFDQTLNAMLLLSYAALRQGDSVGFITFGGQQRYFAPQKGQQAINQILNKIYDLETTQNTADYSAVAKELLIRQRKRSLVVVLTNMRDEDESELGTMLTLLRRRHLVLLANLREEILDQIVNTPVNDFAEALRYSATEDYLIQRKQTQTLISKMGALSLDVTAEQLPIALVNRYLDIKRSGML